MYMVRPVLSFFTVFRPTALVVTMLRPTGQNFIFQNYLTTEEKKSDELA